MKLLSMSACGDVDEDIAKQVHDSRKQLCQFRQSSITLPLYYEMTEEEQLRFVNTLSKLI